jgi:hypothetical protein
MSVHISSPGLRSQGLYNRIMVERRKRVVDGAAERLSRAADLLGGASRQQDPHASPPTPLHLPGRRR